MKVALIKPPHIGSHTRGVGFYTSRLLESLKIIPNLKVDLLDLSFNPFAYSNYDLVHYSYFDLFYLTLPPLRMQKTVVTIHDFIPLLFPQGFPLGARGKSVWPIQKTLLKSVDLVLSNSQTSKKDAVKIAGLPEDKIVVTYLAADPQYAPVTDKTKLTAVRDKYHLPQEFALYVGGMNWNKNLPTLVRAIQKENLNLVIAGNEALGKGLDLYHPESRPFVEFQSLIKGDKKIMRLGFVPTEDLATIYSQATVYVQPSHYEGFGLPALEAMSCACPVICGRNSSLVEICADAAVYADIVNIDDLSNKIRSVVDLSVKDRAALKEKLAKQAGKFSWENTAKLTYESYQRVLAGN